MEALLSKPIPRIKGASIDLCVVRTDEEAIAKYTRWISDEEILPFLGRYNRVAQLDDEREWVKNVVKNTKDISFNIVEKKTRNLIGNCSLRQKNRNYILGILIGEKSARERGYGTEAVKMLVDFAFQNLNAHRVCLSLAADNTRAFNCYKRVGFVEFGREHETDWYDGKWHDTLHMEILESNYYQKTRKEEQK